MKVVIQRSLESRVEVEGKIMGAIDKGLVLLVCFEKGDSKEVVEKAAEKISKLRIFEDPETGKMNRDIKFSQGKILAISQFTLSWDGKKGNRPGFDLSMEPDKAEEYFEIFCSFLEATTVVEKGVFGASMKVFITNDGPVSFSLSF